MKRTLFYVSLALLLFVAIASFLASALSSAPAPDAVPVQASSTVSYPKTLVCEHPHATFVGKKFIINDETMPYSDQSTNCWRSAGHVSTCACWQNPDPSPATMRHTSYDNGVTWSCEWIYNQ